MRQVFEVGSIVGCWNKIVMSEYFRKKTSCEASFNLQFEVTESNWDEFFVNIIPISTRTWASVLETDTACNWFYHSGKLVPLHE